MFSVFLLVLLIAFSWLLSGVIVDKLNKKYYIKGGK
jgi:hypothetical protein